jgi:hypothetical protein
MVTVDNRSCHAYPRAERLAKLKGVLRTHYGKHIR